MSVLDDARRELADLRERLGDLADTLSNGIDDAQRDADRLAGMLDPAVRLLPPPARSFQVADSDIVALHDVVRRELGGDIGDEVDETVARLILEEVYAHLAHRADVGGPEVTDADVKESKAVASQAHRDGVDAFAALLEHDRARVDARTAGTAGEVSKRELAAAVKAASLVHHVNCPLGCSGSRRECETRAALRAFVAARHPQPDCPDCRHPAHDPGWCGVPDPDAAPGEAGICRCETPAKEPR